MRAIRQSLSSRGLSRLEVVVPQDLAVSVLNARHRELAALEERFDCRILFTADGLMKAREFRLLPTTRKGERREREKPVRPSLLAPLMVEQAKALALVKEVAAMKPDDLERELENGVPSSVQPAAQPVAVQAPVVRTAPSVWEEAATLRRLLFSPNVPVAASTPVPSQNHGGRDLARSDSAARVPRRSRGRRRR